MAKPKKSQDSFDGVTADNERARAVEVAVSQIERQFGRGSIMKLGDAGLVSNIKVIPTGSIALDIAIGVGGIPRGRITEIFGPESSGKTTLCLHVIAEAQKKVVTLHLWTQSMRWTPTMPKNSESKLRSYWYPSRTQGSRPLK